MALFNYTPPEKSLIERESNRLDPSKLINFISTQRKEQLKIYGNNDPRFLELEKKFGKYLLVPLALPEFEIGDREKFLAWWKNKCTVPIKLKGDTVMQGYGFSPFEAVDLLHTIGEDWTTNLQTNSFKQEFPKLYQQFFVEISKQ